MFFDNGFRTITRRHLTTYGITICIVFACCIPNSATIADLSKNNCNERSYKLKEPYNLG